MTKEHIRVGRMGCAWLIRRFIDPAAEFMFLPTSQLRTEAERLGATLFHAEGAELARRGDVSSFEVVMEHYGLASDPALALLGRIVNTADIKQSRYRQPEGSGLRSIADGLALLHADDHALNEAGARVYDALYAYCQDMIRRGKPDGANQPAEGSKQ
ncbi:MAG TPA: chromate resistance protein ChrB domain-containing protein [Roseiflexaceae bacterium]|nr:chromate resistance protein ChrB domain-containing protein [Roseiflexaceae bacterium]